MRKDIYMFVLLTAACTSPAEEGAKFVGFHESAAGVTCSTSTPDRDGSSITGCSSGTVTVYVIQMDGVRYELTESISMTKALVPYAVLFAKHGPLKGQQPGTAVNATLDGSGWIRVTQTKGKPYRYKIVSAVVVQ